MHRREFLLSAACAAVAPAQTLERRNQQSGMAYRRLGRTGYNISEMVMGGNTITPENYRHVLEAIDRGLNYLDTAPAYGNGKSEEGYAIVIKSRPRDKFFLNTKVSPWDINRNKLYQEIFQSLDESERKKIESAAREEIERRQAAHPDYFVNYFGSQRGELDHAAIANVMETKYGRKIDRGKNYRQIVIDSIEQSLKRLGTDHLDLMMCPHGASTPAELLNYPEIFDAFETLKKAGKVRHLGVSAHSDPGGVLEAAVKAKVYSAAMVAFNIVNRSFVESALAQAHKSDLGVIAMKVARPVAAGPKRPYDAAKGVKLIEAAVSGGLKPEQKAYVWALRNPNLTAVISEINGSDLLRENLPLAAVKKPA